MPAPEVGLGFKPPMEHSGEFHYPLHGIIHTIPSQEIYFFTPNLINLSPFFRKRGNFRLFH